MGDHDFCSGLVSRRRTEAIKVLGYIGEPIDDQASGVAKLVDSARASPPSVIEFEFQRFDLDIRTAFCGTTQLELSDEDGLDRYGL